MANIINQANFNPANLGADDLYIEVVNPPSTITGVPTDLIAYIGTASYGPVNSPQLLSSSTQASSVFGPTNAASLTDVYDMPTYIALSYQQVQSGLLQIWAIRVTDGTDTKASVALKNSSTEVAGTLATLYSGSLGNAFSVIISNGTKASTSSVIIVPFSGTRPEQFINIPNSSFFSTLANYLQNGQSNFRGPSALVRMSTLSNTLTVGGTITAGDVVSAIFTSSALSGSPITVSYTVLSTDTVDTIATGLASAINANATLTASSVNAVATTDAILVTWPATLTLTLSDSVSSGSTVTLTLSAVQTPTVGTFVFSGGTDGRLGVTNATLIGQNTTYPVTGIYQLPTLNPAPGTFSCCGVLATDATSTTAEANFSLNSSIVGMQAFPAGTNVQSAVTASQNAGIFELNWAWAFIWLYWYDTNNAQIRLVPPTPVILGVVASIPPSDSPANLPVYGIIGTERNSPYTGNNPLSLPEIALLANSGIMFIDKPIPAANVFGVRESQVTAIMNEAFGPANGGIEVARMTNFLELSLADSMGQFVDKKQSARSSDPLRASIRAILNAFGTELVQSNLLDSFLVTCTFQSTGAGGLGINTPSSISQHFIYALFQAKYLSVARFFVIALQGGTTTVTSGASSGSGLTG